MSKFFNLKKRTDDTYSIKIMGAIGDWWDDYLYDGNTIDTSIRDKLSQLPNTVKTLEVYINSPGGSVTQGLSIYNQLRTSGLKIRTFNLGETSSISSIIFLAGDERIMPDGTFALIHQPAHLVYQNLREAEQNYNMLKAVNDSLKSIYLKYINISSDELDKLMESETIITSEQGLKIGFATSNTLPHELKIDASVAYANRIANTHNFLEVQKNLCIAKQNEIFNEVNMIDKDKQLLEAKLQALESEKNKIENEFKAYKENHKEIDLEALKLEIRNTILEEFKNIETIKNKAQKVGITAVGETANEIMKNILIEASISKDKIESFDDSQLEILVDYVISNKKEVINNDEYTTLVTDESKSKLTVSKNNTYANLGKNKVKGK